MKRILLLLIILFANFCLTSKAQEQILTNGAFHIVVPDALDAPVKKAATALQDDFLRIMGNRPTSVNAPTGTGIEIIIVQDDKETTTGLLTIKKELDDFESHRVYADPENNRIYLYGKDMRGTIYAIYTFSEEILGVPPFWYFASFDPEIKSEITIPADLDIFYKSPEVRYRAWFPNDQDCFQPFRSRGTDQNEKWLEALLRLKMNTLECGTTIDLKNKTLNSEARLVKSYGIVLTSHHMVFLNNDWANWDTYWKDVRGMATPPARSTKNFEQMKEYFAYSIDCVLNSGVENLWQIACRGINDNPFWNAIEDAPSSDQERGAFITKCVTAQYELIREKTGEENPFVRMTFYNELSDLLAKGYITPPAASNMLWTYVAARRNHYPAADLVQHDKDVKLGYYFNFQFTSTGSHLAPAEGPWKMEDNYRYLRSKGPVTFSVVNMGNLREYWLEAYCNAKLLWDYMAYDTDRAVVDYCAQYFGEEHAEEAAQIYHDFYYSYYQQKESDFTCINGRKMDRQYILQDLRYSRCISNLCGKDWNSYSENPFSSDFDGIPQPMVPNLINGMSEASYRFSEVCDRAERLYASLDSRKQQFYYDHCLSLTRFMSYLSDCLYHLAYAYKNSSSDRAAHTHIAYHKMVAARDALYANQHDIFDIWYTGHRSGPKFDLEGRVNNTKSKADAYKLNLLEMEETTLSEGAVKVSGIAYSGGKTVHGLGGEATATITYEAPADGVYDLYIQYASKEDARVEATANGTTLSRVFMKTGGISIMAASTIQVNLKQGTNTIVIGNSEGTCPDLDAYCLTLSSWKTTETPEFDDIRPGEGNYAGLDYNGHNASELFYLYNIGQQKYVKTGGISKNPDMPTLVESIEEATAQQILPLGDGTYLIADPDWRDGWGVQGRQCISISTCGAESSVSWGTTLTPGWTFQSTGTDGQVYIKYTWEDFTPGSYSVEDPSGKCCGLYYGAYSQATDQWSRPARNEVKVDGIYGGLSSTLAQYGDNAKWQIIPVKDGTVEVLPYDPTGISSTQVEHETSGYIYNLQGQRVSNPTKGIYLMDGKKIVK